MVREAKVEIARVQGTRESKQELYKLATRAAEERFGKMMRSPRRWTMMLCPGICTEGRGRS